MSTWSIYGVEFNATVVGGITQQAGRLGTTIVGEARSGEPYPRNKVVTEQKPEVDFTSIECAAALAQCGALGSSIADLAAGLKLYAYMNLDGGLRATGSTHRKITIVEGIVYPTTLSWQNAGLAQVAYRAMAKYDGSNAPIASTDDSAVPTASDDDERFSCGPVTIGGVSIDQVTSLNIEFGIEVMAKARQGAIWPTDIWIKSISPTITITTDDVLDWAAAAIPTGGLACTQANTILYLRKWNAGGTGFVTDVTAQHIKLAAAGLAHVETPFDGSGSDEQTTTLKLEVAYDGTNAPIAINTASAIT